MTDRERVVRRLKRLIKAAHNEMSDFVFVTVGTANVIVRLLEEQEHEEICPCKKCECYECEEVCDEYKEWKKK